MFQGWRDFWEDYDDHARHDRLRREKRLRQGTLKAKNRQLEHEVKQLGRNRRGGGCCVLPFMLTIAVLTLVLATWV